VPDIASICVSEGLYEEAFVIFKKYDDKKAAIMVLLDNIGDLERAKAYILKKSSMEWLDIIHILGRRLLRTSHFFF
jgi:hypothetical protein